MDELFFVTQSFIDLKKPRSLELSLVLLGQCNITLACKNLPWGLSVLLLGNGKKGEREKKTMRNVIDIVEIFLILKDRENKRIGWK